MTSPGNDTTDVFARGTSGASLRDLQQWVGPWTSIGSTVVTPCPLCGRYRSSTFHTRAIRRPAPRTNCHQHRLQCRPIVTLGLFYERRMGLFPTITICNFYSGVRSNDTTATTDANGQLSDRTTWASLKLTTWQRLLVSSRFFVERGTSTKADPECV